MGAVLCGGASSRMGSDKSLLPTPNGPLAGVVAAALGGAGCTAVVLVGGDGAALAEATGIPWVPDLDPGEGPLGGVATVAAHHPGRTAVVCACDLPWIRASDLAGLLDPVLEGTADVGVPVVGGMPQWSAMALSARAAAALAGEFRAGERALHRAVARSGLAVAHVVPGRPEAVADVDRPEDLPPGWDRPDPGPPR
ncbi:molybdenum cofactor guanylyltransferase [Dermatobacter hominis]|nr:molybdenum cofactor guanylyltransferase [Dermatobacter hominis]